MGQEREKKNFTPKFCSYPTRARKFQKKKAKNFKKLKILFPALFLAKRDKIGRESEKKNLVPNSLPTQPELENSKKKSKKIQKIKKVNSSIISIQNGLREAEKEIKKI